MKTRAEMLINTNIKFLLMGNLALKVLFSVIFVLVFMRGQTQSFSANLLPNQTFNRPTPGAIVCGSPTFGTFKTVSAGGNVYSYATQSFTVSTAGYVVIEVPFSPSVNDPMLMVYSRFDPFMPTRDFIIGDDDSGPGTLPLIGCQNFFNPGTYTLVVTTYSAGPVTGVVNFNISGVDPVVILPTVSTTPATSLTSSSAILGGGVTDDGGADVTERGVAWGTENNPTTGTIMGSGLGPFEEEITGLTPGTTYYHRAYATNSVGTAYGPQLSFTTLSAPLNPTSILPSATFICIEGSVTLEAIGAEGEVYWYTGGCGEDLVGTGNPITVSPTETTTYYARNFNNDLFSVGCASIEISVLHQHITPTFTQVESICTGETLLELPPTSNNGIAGVWSPALNNTTTTTYTFSPEDGQCAIEANMTIEVVSTPAPMGNSFQSFCGSSSPTIAELLVNGTNIQWYLTDLADTPVAVSTPLDHNLTYYASQTIDGCESIERLVVTVSLIYLQIIASETNICSGTNVTLEVTTSFKRNKSNYEIIDFSDRFNSNSSDPSFMGYSDLSGMQTGNVVLNSVPFFVYPWTNNVNCWNAEFEGGDNPRTLEFSFPYKMVYDLNLLANTYWGISGPDTYVTIEFWDGANLVYSKNLIGDIDIRDFNESIWTNLINNVTSVNVYDNGDRRIDKIKIELPVPQTIDKIIINDNGNSDFQRIFVMAATIKQSLASDGYLWSTGETTSSINVAPTETTEYWVDVTENGVTCRDFITINVNPLPTVTLSAFDPICEDSSPFELSGGNPAGGIYSGPGVVDGWFDPQTTGSGPFEITYELTDSNGCTNSALQNITVNSVPGATISGSTTICLNGIPPVVTFSATNGSPPYTFSYEMNGGVTQTIITTNGLSEVSIQFDPSQIGTSIFNLLGVEDSSGCVATVFETAIIEVIEVDIEISLEIDNVSCFGFDNGRITINATGGAGVLEYSVDNGNNFFSSTVFENLSPNTYNLIVRDEFLCTATTSAIILEPELMEFVNVEIQDVYCRNEAAGGSIMVEVTGGIGNYSYSWFNQSNTLIGGNSEIIQGIVQGTYSVIISDLNGCILEQNFFVGYDDKDCIVRIPQGFSPNGDGKNDVWEVRNLLYMHPDNRVRIFNRHGTLIFEAEKYDDDWDGSPNRGNVLLGQDGKVPQGVYFYMIWLEPDDKPISGYVYVSY